MAHRNWLLGLVVLSIFSFQVLTCLALPVECVTKATQRVHGADTLFIFRDAVELHSTIGAVDWYSTETGAVVRTNDEYLYPDDGGYFIVKNGVEYSPFYVFRCKSADLQMEIEPTCENTAVHLAGDAAAYKYIRRNGTQGSYARACSIDYNALVWNGEQWADSAVSETYKLANTIFMPALYAKTSIKLCYDSGLRDTLELEPACLETDIPEEAIRAVNFQLTSLVTTRGQEGEKSNERNRPTSQTLITGSEYSGPLEVAFYSNPTPAAQFFRWTVYKATERLVTRNDQDIRFAFIEPGSYRVVCSVNNPYCASDSMETTVAVAESYLAVPNAFTPNGDGQNDEFRVAYRSLREFHCWVYNRWGKLVYEWTDPAKGWDGTINGRPAAEGAYFYVIRALGTDADKNARYIGLKADYQKRKARSDESVMGVYQLSGDINLLRGKR